MVASTLVAVPVLVSQATPAAAVECAAGNVTVTTLHGPSFYVDLGETPVLNSAYAGYSLTNSSGSTLADLWVRLDSFSGGSVALGSGQEASQFIGNLANSASSPKFF